MSTVPISSQKPQSQRAKNRQRYQMSKQTAQNLGRNLTQPAPITNNSEGSLPELTNAWENLSLSELAAMEPTRLAEMQAQMTPAESQRLYQKVRQAVAAELGPTEEPFLPPSAILNPSLLSSSQSQATGSNENSGVDAEPPESLGDLKAPLTGKDKRRYQDIVKLLSLGAGWCLMMHKVTGRQAFYADAEAIGEFGLNVAESWARLARKYEWLGIGLDWALGASEVGLMLASTGQLVQAIGNNHGLKTPVFHFGSRLQSAAVA